MSHYQNKVILFKSCLFLLTIINFKAFTQVDNQQLPLLAHQKFNLTKAFQVITSIIPIQEIIRGYLDEWIECQTIEAKKESVTASMFVSQTNYAVIGVFDKLQVWQTNKIYTLDKKLDGHAHAVNALACSFNGEYLASGSSDFTIRIWKFNKKMQSYVCIQILRDHTNRITSLLFSFDGTRLVSSSSDKTIKCRKLIEDQYVLITTITTQEPVHSVSLAPNNAYLASSSKSTVSIWKFSKNKWKFLKNLEGNKVAQFAPNGKYLAAGSGFQVYIYAYKDDQFELIQKCDPEQPKIVQRIQFSGDSRYILVGQINNNISIWKFQNNYYEWWQNLAGHDYYISSFAISPNNQDIISASVYKIKVWRNITIDSKADIHKLAYPSSPRIVGDKEMQAMAENRSIKAIPLREVFIARPKSKTSIVVAAEKAAYALTQDSKQEDINAVLSSWKRAIDSDASLSHADKLMALGRLTGLIIRLGKNLKDYKIA
jgi:WD40 repeat protein